MVSGAPQGQVQQSEAGKKSSPENRNTVLVGHDPEDDESDIEDREHHDGREQKARHTSADGR